MRPKPSQAPGLSPVLQRPRGEPPELLRREHQAPPRSVTGPCPTRFNGLWRRCDNTLEKILNGRLEDARCFATIDEDEDRCVADIGGETFEGHLCAIVCPGCTRTSTAWLCRPCKHDVIENILRGRQNTNGAISGRYQ